MQHSNEERMHGTDHPGAIHMRAENDTYVDYNFHKHSHTPAADEWVDEKENHRHRRNVKRKTGLASISFDARSLRAYAI